MLQSVKNVKLSPPWITYCHKIESLFKNDPEVEVMYDNEEVELKIYVSEPEKADALIKLLPNNKEFGNVTLKITVIPPDNKESKLDLFRKAFNKNPDVVDIYTASSPLAPAFSYIIFKKEVVQFFNDDLTDVHGNLTTLNETIATEIFGEMSGIYFCTDNGKEDNIGKPLGEWP